MRKQKNKHVLKAEWVTLKWFLPWNSQKQMPFDLHTGYKLSEEYCAAACQGHAPLQKGDGQCYDILLLSNRNVANILTKSLLDSALNLFQRVINIAVKQMLVRSKGQSASKHPNVWAILNASSFMSTFIICLLTSMELKDNYSSTGSLFGKLTAGWLKIGWFVNWKSNCMVDLYKKNIVISLAYWPSYLYVYIQIWQKI